MLIRKSDVRAPSLPEEVISVPELNGDVIVRGLTLGARMALSQRFRDKPKSGHGFDHISSLLSLSVLDADGEPIFTTQEWEAWGAVNTTAAINLWDVAWRLSDMDGKQAEKNEKAPISE
jgi:hypothetical protein